MSMSRTTFMKTLRAPVTAAFMGFLAAGSARAQAQIEPVQFPRDLSRHATVWEWWYTNGELRTVDQAGPDKHYAFIFSDITTVMMPAGGTVGVLAIEDLDAGTYEPAETPGMLLPGVGHNTAFQPTTPTAAPWFYLGDESGDYLYASSANTALALAFQAESKDVTLWGQNGVVDMKGAGIDGYYSRTRREVSGWVNDHGTWRAVEGGAWFDHEYGNGNLTGWKWRWFGISLDGGVDLNVSDVWDAGSGTLLNTMCDISDPVAAVSSFGNEVTVTDVSTWTGPDGVTYPMEWTVEVPSQGTWLDVKPYFPEQLMPAALMPSFWEGACTVEGFYQGEWVEGRAFTELYGYK